MNVSSLSSGLLLVEDCETELEAAQYHVCCLIMYAEHSKIFCCRNIDIHKSGGCRNVAVLSST